MADEFELRAIKTLQKRCDEGVLSACNNLGISYQNINQHQKAAEIYQKACDFGYQNSCANLANIYAKAQGVEKDEQLAEKIYSKSCTNGGLYSCYFLGELFRQKQNFIKAANAYHNGCNLGDIPSCVNLGGLYELGLGVSKDLKRAFELYKISCKNSDKAACENLARLKNTNN